MRLSFVPAAGTADPAPVRAVRAAHNSTREPRINSETQARQGLQLPVRVVRAVRVKNSHACKNTGSGTGQPVQPLCPDTRQGGNSDGTVVSDEDLLMRARALLERYGAHLDFDDLLEGIRERFAIVAESAPDDVALQLALTEAETVILRAMQSTRHGHQGNKHE